MTQKLTIADLVAGLDQFGMRYNALDVFADDVADLGAARAGRVPRGWRRLDDPALFEVRVGSTPYYVRLFENAGVVRLLREPDVAAGSNAAGGALIGALAGAAIGVAASKKGEGLVGGLLLGLLVGAMIGNAQEPSPHHVFTMRFDPATRSWRTYNGALVRWMKSELSPVAA